MKLLNSGNAKTRKGEKLGFKTYGLHLAPAGLSGYNVCVAASAGCRAACLNTAGRGAMSSVQKARIAKTKWLFTDREAFLVQLHKEITAAIKSCARQGLTPVFRLNLTSDIPWEATAFHYMGKSIFAHFPDVQFYDYTKIKSRIWASIQGKLPKNYHLTFSRSECNDGEVYRVLQGGGNVAVVFRGSLPEKWSGYKVVNGDETDLRFRDGSNVIVGLVEKGKAKKDESGFVVEV